MSFQSRQKKRRSAAAKSRAQQNRTPETNTRWFLTLATRKCCCNECGGVLPEKHEIVYRHTPRTVLCEFCADRQGIKARPSMRWEQAHKRGR